jgi:3-oxoacyl-[acyl-carrier protein] reductase
VKVALITGAASGIGRHLAEVLSHHSDGYRLALADIDREGLEAAFAASDTLRLHTLDIRSLDAWQRVVEDTLEHLGPIDYLFNIAGGGRPRFFVEQPAENIDLMVDLNLKGPLYGMRLVAEHMVARGSGHIINVASLAGLSPTPGNSLYSAAKSGLRAVSIAAGIELRKKGVFVTVICPDVVDTPLIRQHLALGEEVALIYTGSRILEVRDLEEAFFEAMASKPLEIAVPRLRGVLAKLAGVSPTLALKMNPALTRKGLKRLETIRREQGQKN